MKDFLLFPLLFHDQEKKEIEGRILGALSYNTHTKRLIHELTVFHMSVHPHQQMKSTKVQNPQL